MYADNNSLKVGDTLIRGEKSWKITGLVALSDYSALFQNNNDSMFDSVKFGVAIVARRNLKTWIRKSSGTIMHGYMIISQRTKKRRRKFPKISWKTLAKW